jgi:hypothetical protein
MSNVIVQVTPSIQRFREVESNNPRIALPLNLGNPLKSVKGKNPDAHRTSFESVIKAVKDCRLQRVSEHEQTVTTTLAGPFTQGGLLILLQEPLGHHPWSEGVEQVISRCPTLNLLREAIALASDGTLSLVDDVTVIDRWPLLCPAHRKSLSSAEIENIEKFLRQTLYTKKPDAILCMGLVRYILRLFRGKH